VFSASFSPDGQRIASNDGTSRIWNAATGKLIGDPLVGHHGPVRSASFSPDGKSVVTGSEDETARVWSAVFSPDGKMIVAASDDKTARLWDAATGQPIGEPMRGHADKVRTAAFGPDSRRVHWVRRRERAAVRREDGGTD
jgi:WD40 repeat protein